MKQERRRHIYGIDEREAEEPRKDKADAGKVGRSVGINVWFWQAVYLELGVSAEPEKAVCKKSGYVCGA